MLRRISDLAEETFRRAALALLPGEPAKGGSGRVGAAELEAELGAVGAGGGDLAVECRFDEGAGLRQGWQCCRV